jgi:acyl phosphate:glycerol-3-phosphate acyltransferase
VFSLSLAGALGYLLGSIPTAYAIVHWKSRIDIRSAGSGNAGTLNSYHVTGSKGVGGAVLLLDFLKGVCAVLLAWWIWEGSYSHAALASVGVVAGHNFPVWLRFRGGRGLATGAGVFALIAWPVVPAWGILWGGAYLLLRSVNPANAAATIGVMLGIVFGSEDLIARVTTSGVPAGAFRLAGSVVLVIILLKHIGPVLEYIQMRRTGRRPGADREQAGGSP